MANRIKSGAVGVLAVLCAASLAVAVFGVYRYRLYQREIIEPLREDLVRRTRDAASRIEASLAPARRAAEELALRLTDSEVEGEQALIRQLRHTIESDGSFFGGAVAFAPHAFDSERRLYAPYVAKKNGGLEFLRIEDEYDYTEPEWEWYGAAMAEGSRWSEPYFDTSIGDIFMTTYSAVFQHPDPDGGPPEPRGVVTVDISMDVIRDIVRSLDLGGMGYAALLSRDGKFLYHPDSEIVLSGIDVISLAERSGDVELVALAKKTLQGGSGIADHTAPHTGLDSWFVYEPVPTTGWALVGVYIKDDIPIDNSVLRRWKMVIGAALVVFAWTGLALGLGVVHGHRDRLWAFSTLASLALVAGIGYTWHVSLTYDSENGTTGRITNDFASLVAFEDASTRRSRDRLTRPPVFLPTGVYVDSLRFVSRTDVEIRGYVWQKYHPELHAGVDRGFLLAGVAGLEIGDPMVERVAGIDVVRWSFNAAARVRFDYSKFPLMRERISLRLRPRALSHSIVLVPDLEAYEILSPAARPGLDDGVYLPGWEVTRTFFEFRDTGIRTDFGLGESSTKDRHPSLYFNIEIRKDFVDTFVSNLVPLIIVAIVVFLVLMIMDRDESRIALMRTGTGFNLSICATLLFVAVFSHIGARQKIAAQEIIYLEYFYIVMYFAILWVAVNSIVIILRPSFWFTRHHENLLSRVFFWPTTLGALWVLTLATFL